MKTNINLILLGFLIVALGMVYFSCDNPAVSRRRRIVLPITPLASVFMGGKVALDVWSVFQL